MAKLHFYILLCFTFRALVVESPREGAIKKLLHSFLASKKCSVFETCYGPTVGPWDHSPKGPKKVKMKSKKRKRKMKSSKTHQIAHKPLSLIPESDPA